MTQPREYLQQPEHNRHYAKYSERGRFGLALPEMAVQPARSTITRPAGSLRMLIDTEPRPCHQIGTKPNACAAQHYNRVTYNDVALHGPWEGWRLAGRNLVAPDRQRISPERLRGLLFRQASETRLAMLVQNRRSPPAIKHLPARERFDGQA